MAKIVSLPHIETLYKDLRERIFAVSTDLDKVKLDNLAAAIKLEVLDDTDYDSSTGIPTIIGQSNVIYLVPDSTIEGAGSYIEWVYVENAENAWERIGTTAVDLSGYVQGSVATETDYNSLIDFADTSFPAETFVTLTTGTTYNYTGN